MIFRNPSAGFWKGKRVFVTGHTGFKGGWLSLWLARLGAEVYGYSLKPPTKPNLFDAAKIKSAIARHQIADIRDPKALLKAMKSFKPDIVLHLAAQPILRLSYDMPVATFETNVMGTVNVLEAARQTGARVTLIVTTDKCYENKEQLKPYRETDAMGGFDPYSSSKGCAELATSAYGRSFFNKGTACVASVRAGNVIGGGDWAKDRLMTDIIAALSKGERPVLRNPAAIRPWQHVLEPLAGYLLAVETLWKEMPKGPECWNFGPENDSAVPVGIVANKVCKIWGGGIKPKIVPDARKLHEAKLLRLDSRKAKADIGWSPRLTLDQALDMTVDWAKARLGGGDMKAVTLAQIKSYESLIHTEGKRIASFRTKRA